MDLEKLAKDAVARGLSHLPLDAPYDVRNAVEAALLTAASWMIKELAGQVQPKEVKVKVKKGAKATATVEK